MMGQGTAGRTGRVHYVPHQRAHYYPVIGSACSLTVPERLQRKVRAQRRTRDETWIMIGYLTTEKGERFFFDYWPDRFEPSVRREVASRRRFSSNRTGLRRRVVRVGPRQGLVSTGDSWEPGERVVELFLWGRQSMLNFRYYVRGQPALTEQDLLRIASSLRVGREAGADLR